MILVFGGAYQGKLEYAIKNYGLEESDIHDCSEQKDIDFSKKCIYKLEEYIYNMVDDEVNAVIWFAENKELFKDKVLICQDISNGIVPANKKLREYRETVGRVMIGLGNEADIVVRVFCGIGKKIN